MSKTERAIYWAIILALAIATWRMAPAHRAAATLRDYYLRDICDPHALWLRQTVPQLFDNLPVADCPSPR